MERANAAELFLFRYLGSAQTKSVKRVFLVHFPPLTRFCFGTVVLIIPLPHTTILPTQTHSVTYGLHFKPLNLLLCRRLARRPAAPFESSDSVFVLFQSPHPGDCWIILCSFFVFIAQGLFFTQPQWLRLTRYFRPSTAATETSPLVGSLDQRIALVPIISPMEIISNTRAERGQTS